MTRTGPEIDWKRIADELATELIDRIESDHVSCDLTTDECYDAQYGANPEDHERYRELQRLRAERTP